MMLRFPGDFMKPQWGRLPAASGLLLMLAAPALAASPGPVTTPPPNLGATKAAQPSGPTADPNARPAPIPFVGCDAGCVRANSDPATRACVPVIEAQSPTDYDWLNRPVPGIFAQAEQPEGKGFVVKYRGDVVRFQTPQKDWVRMSYECAYDVEAKKVVAIKMHPGRLQLPQAPLEAATILPWRTVMAQPGGARPAQPARVLVAVPRPTMAQASMAQSRPKRRPAPVGEPSPIDIQQQSPRVLQ